MYPHPQPLSLPHIVTGTPSFLSQAKTLRAVDYSFLPRTYTPNAAHSSFKLYPKSGHISPPPLLLLGLRLSHHCLAGLEQ